MKIAQAFST